MMRRMSRASFACVVSSGTLLTVAALAAARPSAYAIDVQAAQCVTLGAPKPTQRFAYRYADSSGSVAEYTNQWLQITATRSRLKTTKVGSTGPMESEYISDYDVVDDVLVLKQTAASGVDGGGTFNNRMLFQPGSIGDPVGRACAGKSWTIPRVTATHQSTQGRFQQTTDAGTLTIVAIREVVTVPAGRIETVHYTRRAGALVDEFWKSIEHGVTVRHIAIQPRGNATEELTAIK
jgi:hypothetical protein